MEMTQTQKAGVMTRFFGGRVSCPQDVDVGKEVIGP